MTGHDDIRENYINGVWNDGAGESGPQVGERFDAWMAEHDQNVAAAAWGRGQTAGLAQKLMNEITPNPYIHDEGKHCTGDKP